MVPRSSPAVAMFVAGLAALPALAGCGTAYTPRPSPRLAVVTDGGGIALARNGRTYPLGMFGSGLDDAVKGSARAEKEASSYQSKSIGGFVIGILGTAASAGGVGLLVGNELSNNPTGTARAGALALTIGGVVTSIVATVLTSSAQPHMWNAINMYNDDLPPPWGFGAPWNRPTPGPTFGPQPGGYAPPPYAAPPYAAPPTWTPPAAPLPGAPAPLPSGFAPPGPPPPSQPAPMPSAPPPPGGFAPPAPSPSAPPR